jgi:DNA-binding IclR family transcriptional regulator
MTEPIEKSERSGIQVIARAAAIRRELGANPDGLSLGRIAGAVELPRSTVQRIVGALQAERLVMSDSQGGRLRIGPQIKTLAELSRLDVIQEIKPFLIQLTQQTGETADLSVMRSEGMIFLDQVVGRHRLRAVSAVGEVFPLTSPANGKACLAQLSEDHAQRLIADEWRRDGVSGDMGAMMAQLAEIRETGLAYDNGDHTPGLSGIGFAFRDRDSALHAISVPIPAPRFDDARASVEAMLRTTSAGIADLMSSGVARG